MAVSGAPVTCTSNAEKSSSHAPIVAIGVDAEVSSAPLSWLCAKYLLGVGLLVTSPRQRGPVVVAPAVTLAPPVAPSIPPNSVSAILGG